MTRSLRAVGPGRDGAGRRRRPAAGGRDRPGGGSADSRPGTCSTSATATSRTSAGRATGWRPTSAATAGARPTRSEGCCPGPSSMATGRPRSGYRAGLQIADDRDVTAVFAGNDSMALGLLRALHERGRRVPEDISVVGLRRRAGGGLLLARAHHGDPGLLRARPAGARPRPAPPCAGRRTPPSS